MFYESYFHLSFVRTPKIIQNPCPKLIFILKTSDFSVGLLKKRDHIFSFETSPYISMEKGIAKCLDTNYRNFISNWVPGFKSDNVLTSI